MDLKNNYIDIHVCPNKLSEPHIHDFLELAYVLKGSAVHKINESEEIVISEGDYFIIDYHTVHCYQSVDNRDLSVINCIFVPQFIDKILVYCKDFDTLLRHYLIHISSEYSQPRLANRIFHDEEGRILCLLRQMLDEYGKKNIGWREIMRSKMIEILIITARKLSLQQNQDIIASIVLQVHKSYNQNITLGMLAEEMNYSLPYISKLFKEKTGMTFRAYLQKTRIDEACRLIVNTEEKISAISKAVGYADIDFFCKLFKKITGTTPNKFRTSLNL